MELWSERCTGQFGRPVRKTLSEEEEEERREIEHTARYLGFNPFHDTLSPVCCIDDKPIMLSYFYFFVL